MGTPPSTAAPVSSLSTLPTMSTDPRRRLELNSAIEESVADLVRRLDVDPSSVALVNAEIVVWPDGSLGCPQPEEVYNQSEVEGFKVVLEAGDRLYHYHAGSDARPNLCGTSSKQGGGPGTPEPSIPPPIQ